MRLTERCADILLSVYEEIQEADKNAEDGADKVDEGYFRSLIGCLMYLTATRPDILNAVSILSRFMHCASELHLKVAKRVIRYVKGTSDFGVKFTKSKEFKLVGFSDSDWANSIDDKKKYLRLCFLYGNKAYFIVIKQASYCGYVFS